MTEQQEKAYADNLAKATKERMISRFGITEKDYNESIKAIAEQQAIDEAKRAALNEKIHHIISEGTAARAEQQTDNTKAGVYGQYYGKRAGVIIGGKK